MEVLRFSSLVPLSIPHGIQWDTELNGYHIPKGAMVLINLWGCHNDPTYFENPDDFKPERFLTADGQLGDLFICIFVCISVLFLSEPV